MPELAGTKTQKNLKAAFAGESQARNKYTYFASVARKEGYEQIAAIFLETADQEKTHAKLELRLLDGIGDTAANLKAAAAGEADEWTEMYPQMAAEAREEGFDDIARLFDAIARVEKAHQARYQKLLDNLNSSAAFKRPTKMKWTCRECGFTVEAEKAPDKCPLCKHPQAFFEIVATNY